MRRPVKTCLSNLWLCLHKLSDQLEEEEDSWSIRWVHFLPSLSERSNMGVSSSELAQIETSLSKMPDRQFFWKKLANSGHFFFIFVLFTIPFQWQIYNLNNMNLKNVVDVLGIWIRGHKMVGADDSTELLRPQWWTFLIFVSVLSDLLLFSMIQCDQMLE